MRQSVTAKDGARPGPDGIRGGRISVATKGGVPRFLLLWAMVAGLQLVASPTSPARAQTARVPDRGAVPGHALSASDLPRSHGTMVDALGTTFPAGPCPQRIVSLSPSLTEVLFAIGVDPSRIAGVTRYCDYPPGVAGCRVVGGILDPSLEEIQMIRPDIVLATRGNPTEVLRRIQDLGIPVFAVDDRTGLDGLHRMIGQIIALTGPDDAATSDALLRKLWREPRAFRAWADSIPDHERPRVYYSDSEHPGWTAGPGSHVDDLIRHAGGVNVATHGAWPQFSAERLLVAQPDVLLLALPEGKSREAALDGLRRAPGFAGLSAVREGRICWVESGRLLRPGPRLLDALEEIAGCLHPDRARPGAGGDTDTRPGPGSDSDTQPDADRRQRGGR